MSTFERPPPHVLERIQRESERALSPEEFGLRIREPLSSEETRERQDLIRWFLRRYPTPAARLAHARRLSRTWLRATHPLGAPAPLRGSD